MVMFDVVTNEILRRDHNVLYSSYIEADYTAMCELVQY